MAAGVFHKRRCMRLFNRKCSTKANYPLANNIVGANGHGIRQQVPPTDMIVGANGHGIRQTVPPANTILGANGHGIRQTTPPANSILSANPTMGSYQQKSKIPRIKSVRIPIERIKPL